LQQNPFSTRALIAALSFIALVSVKPASGQAKAGAVSSAAFPDSLQSQPGILLIQQDADMDSTPVAVSTYMIMRADVYVSGHVNKQKMMEYADKNLTCKHECSSQSDIYAQSGKFADKNLYRYALIISLLGQDQHMKAGTTTQSTYYQPIFRFRIYDRLTRTTYAELGKGSSIYMWAFRSAIGKISKKE